MTLKEIEDWCDANGRGTYGIKTNSRDALIKAFESVVDFDTKRMIGAILIQRGGREIRDDCLTTVMDVAIFG